MKTKALLLLILLVISQCYQISLERNQRRHQLKLEKKIHKKH